MNPIIYVHKTKRILSESDCELAINDEFLNQCTPYVEKSDYDKLQVENKELKKVNAESFDHYCLQSEKLAAHEHSIGNLISVNKLADINQLNLLSEIAELKKQNEMLMVEAVKLREALDLHPRYDLDYRQLAERPSYARVRSAIESFDKFIEGIE